MDILPLKQTGITIGLPTLGRAVTLQWAFAFKALVPPINFNTVHAIVYGKPVALARNEIVKQALDLNHSYVYFMGDDTIPPQNILKTLIYRMQQNDDHGVISGVYCSKSEPAFPLVFRGNGKGSYWDWKVGEYFEITGCGMDAVLINTQVFKDLLPFVQTDEQGCPEFFRTVDTDEYDSGINRGETWTEDLFFLGLVEKHTKYKIYCDGSMLCDHVDVSTGKVYRLPPDSKPVTGVDIARGKREKKAIDIGCGTNSPKFPDEFDLIRVDIRDEVNPDYRCDVRNLPFNDGYFDVVYSSHVLEHFSRAECEKVLDEWCRLVKRGGELILVLPNIDWAIDKLAKGEGNGPDKTHIYNVLYGGQSNSYDFHYNGWNPDTLSIAVKKRGFDILSIEHNGYNMILTAKLPVKESS